MTNEFTREDRYIVFKMSDLGNSLKGDEIRRLARECAEHRQRLRKKPLECVVVEKDWPEYEPTWRAIEARATGAERPTLHAFDDSATIAGLKSAVSLLSACLDDFRALLVEVDDVCGRDGHGGPLEDGESEIIDKVRAALSMTEASPQPESSVPDVDALAQFIREVDGSHQLGAGVLAERIAEWLKAAPEAKP